MSHPTDVKIARLLIADTKEIVTELLCNLGEGHEDESSSQVFIKGKQLLENLRSINHSKLCQVGDFWTTLTPLRTSWAMLISMEVKAEFFSV